MSTNAAYLQSEDGAYDAACCDKDYCWNLWQLFAKNVTMIVQLFPRLILDFIRAYIWAPKKSVRGQVALVTGGGNGLGKALCLRLAREGCQLAVADIDGISAQKTAEELRDLGAKAEAFKVDVADYRSVQQLRSDIEARLGPVDILVNNAGLLTTFSLTEGKEEDVQKVVNVNLTSHLWTIRVFKDGMVERGRGHIVGISSILGYMPSYKAICYCTTKFGVRGLMQSLDEELYVQGLENQVVATCVYPVFIATRQSLMQFILEEGLLPIIFTPERVADITVDGILRNRAEIIAGPLYIRVFVKLLELLPRRYLRALASISTDPGRVKKVCGKKM